MKTKEQKRLEAIKRLEAAPRIGSDFRVVVNLGDGKQGTMRDVVTSANLADVAAGRRAEAVRLREKFRMPA